MPKKLEKCVKELKKKGVVKNPYAVCNARLGKKSTKGRKKK